MKKLFISVFLFTAFAAYAEELPLGMLAVKIPEAAIAAIKFRDAGKPKDFLTGALPAKGTPMTRTGREMHQIADDIYEFRSVKGLTYYAYTQNRFMQELRGKPAPTQFKEVASEVLACQDNILESDQQKLILCVTGIVNKYVPKAK
jgi:hypothetical protein